MKKSFFTLLLCFGLMMSYGQALKVAASGNVGIGIADPGRPLDVNGDVRSSGSIVKNTGASASQLFNRTDAAAMSMGGGGQQATVTFDQAFLYEIRKATRADVLNRVLNAGTHVFTVKGSNGFVGISDNNPSHLLTVNGDAAKPGGGMWTATSDERLKTNVKEFSDGLEQILEFKPVKFHYNGKGGVHDTENEYVGLIAQEVQEIAPYMVKPYKYQEVTESRNSDGGIKYNYSPEQEWLSINPSALVYMLVNAVQEQQEIIDEKDERITDLESRLIDLENRVSDIINEYDINLGGVLPDQGSLEQNIPNPFKGQTQINFNIPDKASSAELNIFDMQGRIIKTIDVSSAGKGQVNLSADDLPSGTYSYHLVVDNKIIDAKKMVLSN